MQLTGAGRLLRRSIKRFIYSQLSLREGLMILFGKSAPLVMFTIEDEPPSIYLNFRVRPDRLDALARTLELPDGLTLSPIRCIAGEEPFHAITLNVYRVSGLVQGLRAEWSVYVRDPDGVPRYLVAEAQSDAGSMDPVHIVTRAGSMEYAHEADRLRARITCENGGECTFVSELPPLTQREALRPAPEWIEANDYIYWRNGVCDRTFYDGALANSPLWRVPLENLEIHDGSAWAEYVEPSPVHAVLLSKRTQLALSPWWNL